LKLQAQTPFLAGSAREEKRKKTKDITAVETLIDFEPKDMLSRANSSQRHKSTGQ
jgi:hypothetical protein